MPDDPMEYKIVMRGAVGVGKSYLTIRFVTGDVLQCLIQRSKNIIKTQIQMTLNRQ